MYDAVGMPDYSIIIVGAGPAGSAAAIHLANHAPELAARTLIIDKAVFPRKKLCGGGVTHHGMDLLRRLNVPFNVPAYPVHAMRLVYKDREATFRWRDMFHVVQRDEFDTALLRCAQSRGVAVREGVAIKDIAQDQNGVTILTNSGELRAQVVIGADGANSVVRQKLGLVRPDRISRLMEILTPVADAANTPEFRRNTAVFDFSPISRGVQGYYWDFPSMRNGSPMMNRGLFDSRVRGDRPRADLKPALEKQLQDRGLEIRDWRLEGHPERWYDPNEPNSAQRVVLAGDAAGAEPWLGEGISHALNFGMVAADAVRDAFARGDFSFANYSRQVAHSPLGRRLRIKRFIAHYIYGNRGEWFYQGGWRLLQVILIPTWRK